MNRIALILLMVLGFVLIAYAFSTPGVQFVAAFVGGMAFFYPLTTLLLEKYGDQLF